VLARTTREVLEVGSRGVAGADDLPWRGTFPSASRLLSADLCPSGGTHPYGWVNRLTRARGTARQALQCPDAIRHMQTCRYMESGMLPPRAPIRGVPETPQCEMTETILNHFDASANKARISGWP